MLLIHVLLCLLLTIHIRWGWEPLPPSGFSLSVQTFSFQLKRLTIPGAAVLGKAGTLTLVATREWEDAGRTLLSHPPTAVISDSANCAVRENQNKRKGVFGLGRKSWWSEMKEKEWLKSVLSNISESSPWSHLQPQQSVRQNLDVNEHKKTQMWQLLITGNCGSDDAKIITVMPKESDSSA